MSVTSQKNCVLILPKPLPIDVTGNKILKTAIPRMISNKAKDTNNSSKSVAQKMGKAATSRNRSVLQPILPKLQHSAIHSVDKIVIPVTVKNSHSKSNKLGSSHPVIRINSGLPPKNLPSQITVVPDSSYTNSIPETHGIDLDEPLNIGIGNELPGADPPVYINSKQKLCQICGKFLKSSSSLKSHLLSHNPDSPHVCHLCGKGFKFRNRLVCHLRTHTMEKPYSCDICQTSFSSSSNLKRHKKIHLEENNQFFCSICQKNFSSKNALNSHSRLHKKSEFACDICGKTFSSASSLQSHNLHHSRNGNKYQCHLCSKSYSFESLLEKHLDGHRGVKNHHCTICPAKFVWRSSLTSHIQTHSDKGFSCTLCLASFYSEKKLKSHLEKHANPTPHNCSVCSKSFAYKFQLRKHVTKFHESDDRNLPDRLQMKLKAPKVDNVALDDQLHEQFTEQICSNDTDLNTNSKDYKDYISNPSDPSSINPYHQIQSPQYAALTPLQTYGTPYEEKNFSSTPASRNLINTNDPYLNNSLRCHTPPNLLFSSPCQTYNSYLPVDTQEEVNFTPEYQQYEENMPVLDLSLI